MTKPMQDPANVVVDVDLDEEQLAQIDALIEQRSTASHRLTREEVLRLLVEKGCDLVAQGESLLPYLEALPAADDDEEAPSSAPAPDDIIKH